MRLGSEDLFPLLKLSSFHRYWSSLNSHPFLEREEMWFIFSDLWCHWHVGSEMNLELSWPQTIVIILNGAAKKIPLVPLGQWSSTFRHHLRSLLFKVFFSYLICLLTMISCVSMLSAVVLVFASDHSAMSPLRLSSWHFDYGTGFSSSSPFSLMEIRVPRVHEWKRA